MNNRIKEIRTEKRISQEELANISGVSRTTISVLESGRHVITTTSTLQKIANALGHKIEEIFFTD